MKMGEKKIELSEQRILIICKRDYLVRFWKITLEPEQDYPDDKYILKVLEFLQRRGNEYKLQDPRGRFEIWREDKYRSLDYTDIQNIEGKNWPKNFKDVSLFPEANIRTEEDLARYNAWRQSTFKEYIKQLRNSYKWCRKDGIIPALKYKTNWTEIDTSFITSIDPPELLDNLPISIKNLLKRKLNGHKTNL